MTPVPIGPTIRHMTLPIEALEAEVLSLPASDRARLLDRLSTSPDTDRAAEGAWMQEARRRYEEIETGAVKPVPGGQILARWRAGFQ